MRNKKDYLWTLIGKFLPQLLYLITVMILARFLSPDDFGTIGILSVFILVANTIMDAGLGGSLIKESVVSKEDYNTIATFNYFVSILLYLLIVLFAPLIESFYEVEGLSKIIILLSLIFIINAVGLVPLAKLSREFQFKEISWANIFSVIVASILAILSAYKGLGVYSLVIYQIAQNLIRSLFLKIYSKYLYHIQFKISSFKKLISFGLFTTFVNVIDTFYENLLVAIFGKSLGVAEAGYLSQAKKIEEVSTVSVIQTINMTSFPILSKIKDDLYQFKKEAHSIFLTFCLILFPAVIAISVYSEIIVTIIFGGDWIKSSGYLSLLCIAGLFIIMENLNRNFIKSLGRATELFYVTIIKRAFGIGIILLAIFIDIKYALIGYIISSFVAFLFNQIVYCSLAKERYVEFFRRLLMVIIPSLILYLLLYVCYIFIQSIVSRITIAVVILVVYYVVLLYFSNKEKLMSYIKKRR